MYEYIIADDNKNSKKQKTKNGNKNNNNNMNNSNNNNKKQQQSNNTKEKQPVQTSFEQIDKEIEEFKTKIISCSINANNINKVKPKISGEWLQYLSKV